MSEESVADVVPPGVEFVHLHNHSHYSLLDGLQKVPQMLDRIKALGMTAVALTDHGTLSGAIEFYTEAKRRELKPIIGLEAYVAPRKLDDKAGKIDANPYHLTLLAYNEQGYLNLMKLVSTSHLEGYYYKPRVDRDLLAKLHDGLIALSGCASSEVSTHISNGSLDQAETTIKWYQETFGPDNYYLELQDHEHQWAEQKKINQGLTKLAEKLSVPLVVTADSHYCLPSDKEAHEILLCVQTGKTLGDTDRMSMEMDLNVSDPKEIADRWADYPEALANTAKIAERCGLEIKMGQILIPRFEVPTGETEKEYLHKLCWQGLSWRYGHIPKEDMALMTEAKARKILPEEIKQRADYELGVINGMGFNGYFLIVADFINWGKNQGIIFGPGRGSAAGSIVSYALNITDLDPLKFDLLFERFLNPDRISMPDIDIDIQDNRREEVINYVTEKYGQDRVAQIITFGTMAARNAVRDTGRALGMPYAEVDTIAKKVPAPIQGRHIPLVNSAGIVKSDKPEQQPDPDLAREYRENPRTKRLIDLAIRLEGTIRSNGVHAAGVVIAPEPIVNYTPVQRAQKGGVSTQYSMGPIEELGLLKMDFLGLSNLTIINNALRIVRKVYNVTLNLAELPLDDKKTYALVARGETTGVFQFESAGMKRYLRDLKPDKLDDLVAMGALYRPGPMQWIDDFIDRKHGRKKIEYLHPVMKNALESTYGVLVYQEQVMQIAKDMCGFTGGQADTLRKGVAKKIPAVLAKMKKEFIEGAVRVSNVDRGLVEKFWISLEDFAAYCFNKSHAACYAMISYYTAYLKANYPAAFMAALMTSDHDNIDRIAIEVAECRRLGIAVLPPDINQSFLEFGVVPESGSIRFGLAAIKNVGVGAIESILAAREAGKFTSVEDFAKRVNAAEVNKKVWESLIKAGAFDSMGQRQQFLSNLDGIVGYAAKAQKNALSGQIDIFGSLGDSDNLPSLHLDTPPDELSSHEQLGWEKELLGLYLSRHPLDDYDGYLATNNCQPIKELTPEMEGKSVQIGGIITTVRRIVTKNNAAMAFVGLEDKSGGLELIVFPKAFEASPELWEPDRVVTVKGKVSTKDRDGRIGTEIKIMVDKAELINYETARQVPVPVAPEPKPERPIAPPDNAGAASSPETSADLRLSLSSFSDATMLIKVKELLTRYPGNSQVYLVLEGEESKKIRLPMNVEASDELLKELAELLGRGSVTKA